MKTLYKKQILRVHLLEIDVEFPTGISAGAGSFGNRILLARNGRGEMVLHGTAIAGVLRHAYARLHSEEEARLYFGSAQGDNLSNAEKAGLIRKASPLRVDDAPLYVGKIGLDGSMDRVSHLRSRHTGSVVESALYSIEAAPPKTTATFRFQFEETSALSSATAVDGREFLREILGLFKRGLLFGGNSNRGVGLARIKEANGSTDGSVRYQTYDMTDADGFAAYLNDDYTQREKGSIADAKTLDAAALESDPTLRVQFTLEIPRGQDILLSDGEGLDAASEPHRVTGADGSDYWLLPGSSLHGLFRSWILRLAAREGINVADSLEQFEKDGRKVNGDDLGWLFQKKKRNDDEFLRRIDANYPAESMFGSLHKGGRLHISDGLSPVGDNGYSPDGDNRITSMLAADDNFPVQYRVHVAVDPISGGAIEGALFDNFVLTSGGKHPVLFPVTIILRTAADPEAQKREARWLAETLRALHTGLLRVGSSKSAGRLAIRPDSLTAEGPGKDFFENVAAPLETKLLMGGDTPELGADKKDKTSADNANKVVLFGRMDGNISKFVAEYRDQSGTPKKIDIPKTLWGYRPGDAMSKPKVELSFVGGELVDVVIPGKPKIKNTGGGTTSNKSRTLKYVFGSSFHNPYTFIPFDKNVLEKRKTPTLQTAEEKEPERYTGVLSLKVITRSPLMSIETVKLSQEEKEKEKERHQIHRAMRVGKNVIVPASGIRGFLRNLMTITTGSPLTVLDEDMILCQRDIQLTPQDNKTHQLLATPILARVKKAGNSKTDGVIVIGETALMRAEKIAYLLGCKDIPRPSILGARCQGDNVVEVFDKPEREDAPQIKVSGTPVNKNGKQEGVYLRDLSQEINLPKEYWRDYNSRNKFGCHPQLIDGDLVWILPKQSKEKCKCEDIKKAEDIDSLHWARWGRKGQHLSDAIEKEKMLPDNLSPTGQVSAVTDIFGQIRNVDDDVFSHTFKGRVLPSNLVFEESLRTNQEKATSEKEPLAVMGIPHPGCAPFYYQIDENGNPSDRLRGYKVYRTSDHQDEKDAPWKFENQGVYESGKLASPEQNVNKTVELLRPDVIGSLDISFRGLSQEELAMLVALCEVPWRLGGGKPLGLGFCEVKSLEILDERGDLLTSRNGSPVTKELLKESLPKKMVERLNIWRQTQKPVKKMRYPRAVTRNAGNIQRMGATWFMKFAKTKYSSDGKLRGITPINITGKDLIEKAKRDNIEPENQDTGIALPGTPLPNFDSLNPEGDVLYGYDLLFDEQSRKETRINGRQQRQCYTSITPYDDSISDNTLNPREKSGPNAESRKKTKKDLRKL